MKETQREFIERYYKSNREDEQRNSKYQFAIPCDCEDGGPDRHWAMVNIKKEAILDHLDLYFHDK